MQPFEVYELPTYRTSAKELAEKTKTEYSTAQGYIKMLISLGMARQVDTRKVAGAKGKPTIIYEIPASIKAAA